MATARLRTPTNDQVPLNILRTQGKRSPSSSSSPHRQSPQGSHHQSPQGSHHQSPQGSHHQSPQGSPTVGDHHSGHVIEMPRDKAKKHYDVARLFYTDGGGTSIELERVVKELSVSSSYAPTEARHFFFIAKVFRQSLDFASAIYALRYVLKLEPQHGAAKKHLAELLMKHGQEKMCDAVLAQRQGQSEEHNLLQYNTARVFFDECLLLNRTNAKVWMFKGVCHVHLRQEQEALDALARGIHIVTGEVRCYQPWTDKRFENDSKGLSVREVRRLQMVRDADKERHERNVRILCEMHILRGKLYWAAGLTEQGNKDLRFASTLQPEHPEVLVFGAQSFKKAERLYAQCVESFAAGRLEEAAKQCRSALGLSPDDIKLHIMLSKLCRAEADLPSAYSAISRATELFHGSTGYDMKVPEDILQQTNLVYNDMAIQCAGRGEYEKSIALLNKVIDSERVLSRGLVDVNFRFFVNRGDCYRACHELALARADYSLALQQITDPADAWLVKTRLSLTHYLLAADLFNAAEFAPAEAAATRAIECNPQVASYYATRGQARYYLGRYQEAYEDYSRCLELDPGCDEVRLRLAQQYEQSKPRDAAAADAGAFATESPVSSAGFIDPRRQVVDAMAGLRVLPEHRVEAMLRPREVRGLPDIRKSVSASNQAAVASSSLVLAPQPLPVVNPRLTTSWLAAQDVSTCQEKVRRILARKADVGKGALWSALDNARTMALTRCRPAGALSIEERATKEKGADKKGEKSYTSAGLKRYSQELSRAALEKYRNDESFIAGIVTSHDDPFLHSLEQPGRRKQNLHIRIATQGIQAGRRRGEEEQGSCTVFDHEDSPTEADAEKAEWMRLRSSGPAVAEELLQHLAHAPPTPPASLGTVLVPQEAEDVDEQQSLASLSMSTATTLRRAPRQQQQQQMPSRTANKFGSRNLGSRYGSGAGGGRSSSGRGGRGGRLGLRVRFTSEESLGGEQAPDDPDGTCLGVSRIVELLAEAGVLETDHALEDTRSETYGTIVFSEDQESTLLTMTEEEELALAAELRAAAEKKESRRKRDLRRDEIRSKIMAQRTNA